MLTLAVDTSGLTASCALLRTKVIAELSIQHGKTHSQITAYDKIHFVNA